MNALLERTIPIKLSPDYRVFSLFAFLNRYGYDLEGNPEMHPVRVAVRKALAAVPPDPSELAFSQLARPFYPRVGLMEAFALHQDGWPASGPDTARHFRTGDLAPFEVWLTTISPELPHDVEPDFVAQLPAMGEVLAGFEARSNLAELWRRHLPDHLRGEEEMEKAVARGLEASLAVLGLSGWPFRRVRVITNLLQSEWLADQLLIGDELTAVVASAAPSLAPSVLHEALHMVVRPPLKSDQVRAVLGNWQARSEPIRTRMQPQGYWGPGAATGLYRATQEALVRAATIVIWHDDPSERESRARRQVEQGFDLVQPIVAYLAAGNRHPLRPTDLAPALDEAFRGLLA